MNSNNKKPTKTRPPLSSLPFYCKNNKPPSFWNVKTTEDYEKDCMLGSTYANAVLDFNFNPLLGWIVRDMIKANNFGGIEAGFFSVITMHAASDKRFRNLLKKSKEQQAQESENIHSKPKLLQEHES
jgi:hypothetical protein